MYESPLKEIKKLKIPTTQCRGQFGLSYFVRKKQAAQNTPTQIPSLKNAQLPLMTGDKPTASAVRLIAAREQQSCSTSPTGSALRALPIVLVEQQFRLLWPATRSRIDRILLTCGVIPPLSLMFIVLSSFLF